MSRPRRAGSTPLIPTTDEVADGSERPDRLSRRDAADEILTEALAAGLTYEQAGVLAGVTSRTVARRHAEPSFA